MKRIAKDDIKCPGNKKNLTNLCMLYGLHQLYKDNKACYESGYFASYPYSEYILESMKQINKEIRPVALSIIEGSADVPDNLLLSAIGNSYGDIYETHLEWAKNSRLN